MRADVEIREDSAKNGLDCAKAVDWKLLDSDCSAEPRLNSELAGTKAEDTEWKRVTPSDDTVVVLKLAWAELPPLELPSERRLMVAAGGLGR